MVGWHEKGDDLDNLRAHETQLGTRFAVVRVYQSWKLPGSKIGTLVGEGRLVLVSHKPPIGGWAAVASGAEDATIAALAEKYRSYGRQVVFIFHHEPHDDAADLPGAGGVPRDIAGTSGTVADYLAAWRRIHRIFVERGAHRSAGGNVHFGYSATGSWALKSGGDPMYPGDDIVDVLAHDRYNWAACEGDDWEEFSQNWAPLVALAARHGKPLIAGEFGSAPAGGARNDWFRRAGEWMRTDPVARQWLWGFAYYHSLHTTCPWDFLNSAVDDGASGWRDAFSHPYFSGAPFALPAGSLAPATVLPAKPAPLTPVTPPVPPTTTTVTAPKPSAPDTSPVISAPPVAVPDTTVPATAVPQPDAQSAGRANADEPVETSAASPEAPGEVVAAALPARPPAPSAGDGDGGAPWLLLAAGAAAVPLVRTARRRRSAA
jgi:hypothetical protein